MDISSVKVNIVESLDEGTWRSFVNHHPSSNIFHTPEMFHVFERAKGYHPFIYAAVNLEGEILSILSPVQVTIMDGFFRTLTTRSIAYGGFLCSPGPAGNIALDTLLRKYSANAGRSALFTELRHLSDSTAFQPLFTSNGYRYEDHLDYLIDLTGTPVDVLQNIGSRTRKHIRHGMRKGVVIVEQMMDRDLLPAWYSVVCKSYSAASVPLADRSLFEAVFDILQPRGMAQFWLAHVGSTFVAASLELVYKDVIYGWYSGVDRNYADESPGELLMWRVLEQGSLQGYKTYDFGGAGRPEENYGVRSFKAKFGGTLVCYGRNIKIHCPVLLRWSEVGYGVYRQMMGYFSKIKKVPTNT